MCFRVKNEVKCEDGVVISNLGFGKKFCEKLFGCVY